VAISFGPGGRTATAIERERPSDDVSILCSDGNEVGLGRAAFADRPGTAFNVVNDLHLEVFGIRRSPERPDTIVGAAGLNARLNVLIAVCVNVGVNDITVHKEAYGAAHGDVTILHRAIDVETRAAEDAIVQHNDEIKDVLCDVDRTFLSDGHGVVRARRRVALQVIEDVQRAFNVDVQGSAVTSRAGEGVDLMKIIKISGDEDRITATVVADVVLIIGDHVTIPVRLCAPIIIEASTIPRHIACLSK